MLLFQKGTNDADTKIELAMAKRISKPPNLSCNFRTKRYKIKEEVKLSSKNSIIEKPIRRKAFNKRYRVVIHIKSNIAFVAICIV